MARPSLQVRDKVVVEREHLQQLLDILSQKGYQVLGPTIRDGAIVYEEITSTTVLPVGWSDEQEGGTYLLKKGTDEALFGYVVGPHSWKKFLFKPVMRLWQAKREGNWFQITQENEEAPKFAFIGVRSCELHAIAIQDKVFMNGQYIDPSYKSRRENVFIVAVNCGEAGDTCFCVSMNTGPKVKFGFDLALTEVLEADRHYFLVEVGTELGADIFREVPHQAASEKEKQTAERVVANAASHMKRIMDTTNIKYLLYRNYEHSRWDEVATRCLTCGNCTIVCPTCFCTTVDDVTDLTGNHAERLRRWDSCFTMDFSYIHGGSVRASAKARYRQWLTHKLATWIDQFGTSGCVGCGRCITWCPVGIDITEEVRAIRESDSAMTILGKEKNDAND